MLIALVRRMDRRDEGVTLVELLVSMVLLMVIGTMLVLTYLQGMQTVVASDARNADSGQAKTAMENASRALRTAVDPDGAGVLTAFEKASADEVVFYAALGNRNAFPVADDPARKVKIWRNGKDLMQAVALPDMSGGSPTWNMSNPTTTRTIGRDLATGTGVRPLFTYLAAADTATDAAQRSVTSLPTTDGEVTDPAARALIEAVEIWVTVNSSPSKRQSPTTAVSRVTLLNKEG